MFKRKELLLILFVLLFNTIVYANDNTNTVNLPKVYISEDFDFRNETDGGALFLFSKINLWTDHKGNIVTFFSDVMISNEIKANLYCFFSDVTVLDSGKIDNLTVFSSNVIINDATNIKNNIIIPEYFLTGAVIIIKLFICLLLLAIKKSIFEQGTGAVVNEPLNIIKRGVVFYTIILSLSIVFLLTIIGFPLTILLLIINYIVTCFGEVSLGLLIGYLILSKITNRKYFSIYIDTVVGIIVLESLNFIPYIKFIINYFILPICAAGIVSTIIVNLLIDKKFYQLPITYNEQKANKVNNQVKSILQNNLDK